MISHYQTLVSYFHRGIGVVPGSDIQKSIPLRVSLIEEEVKETVAAIEAKSTVQVIDGLCDVLYVTYGTADVYGIELDTAKYETQPIAGLTNWDQLCDGMQEYLKESAKLAIEAIQNQSRNKMEFWLYDLATGCWDCAAKGLGIDLRPFYEEVHRTNMWKLKGPKREDGKQLKPPDWKPPRIEAMYNRIVAGNPPDCVHAKKGYAVMATPHPQGGHFCLDCGGLFVSNPSGADVQ